jgi:hypothetical protein
VMLPGEQNTQLFGLGAQSPPGVGSGPTPPVTSQINALNIFDDGAQGDETGTMTAMGLTGFGMAGPLKLDDNGTYLYFPGGITWGSMPTEPGEPSDFLTAASLTEVDTLNLMLGQGNDHLLVQGTPVPGPQTLDDQTIGALSSQGGLTIVNGGGAAYLNVSGLFNVTASTITRLDGLSWGAYEYAVGQELELNGVPVGAITAVNGATLTVTGTMTVASAVNGTVSVFGPAITSTATYKFGTDTITRPAAQTWASFGFAVGQQVTVNGLVVGTVTKISGSQLTVAGAKFKSQSVIATVAVYTPGTPQVALGGNDITVTGGGGPGPGATLPTVTSSFVTKTNTIEYQNCTTSSKTCSSFATGGFLPGQILSITTPTGTQTLWTVVGYGSKDNGTLTVSGPPLPASGTFTLVAYSSSPLVVFGSSSQSGVFYSGQLGQQSAVDFGSKPFPETIGDGTPDFIYPVADPYRYQGNNVIDLSGLDAGVPEAQLPAYGVTAYGGGGDNTLIDSAGVENFFAISESQSTIVKQNARTQISKLDGLNVSPITRVLSFPTVNTSTYPDAIPLPPLSVIAKGGVPPNSPTIQLSAQDTSSSSSNEWVTTNDHPSFVVTYTLVLDGVTEPPTQYANGVAGVNYALYMNGVLYTGEPLANGTYTVTGTITDYYGNTSPLATAPKELVVDAPPPSPPPEASGKGGSASGGSGSSSSGSSSSAGTSSAGTSSSRGAATISTGSGATGGTGTTTNTVASSPATATATATAPLTPFTALLELLSSMGATPTTHSSAVATRKVSTKAAKSVHKKPAKKSRKSKKRRSRARSHSRSRSRR